MRSWKRGLVVSCSHSEMMLPDALPTLRKFARDWKPDHLVHLGDFLDTTALRGGADGTPDEGADIGFDLEAGLDFLEDFYGLSSASKRILCLGNHDNRPFKLRRHPRAIVRDCAQRVCESIESTAKRLRAEIVPYDIRKGWKRVSNDCVVGHGYMFNQNAVKQHAEMIGCNVIMGHLHRCEVRKAECLNNATGYCIGWLGDENKAGYARERRATLAWENAFATYETNGRETVVQMYKRTKEGWRI